MKPASLRRSDQKLRHSFTLGFLVYLVCWTHLRLSQLEPVYWCICFFYVESFVVVTGPKGSGKSALVDQVIHSRKSVFSLIDRSDMTHLQSNRVRNQRNWSHVTLYSLETFWWLIAKGSVTRSLETKADEFPYASLAPIHLMTPFYAENTSKIWWYAHIATSKGDWIFPVFYFSTIHQSLDWPRIRRFDRPKSRLRKLFRSWDQAGKCWTNFFIARSKLIEAGSNVPRFWISLRLRLPRFQANYQVRVRSCKLCVCCSVFGFLRALVQLPSFTQVRRASQRRED